MNSDLSGDLGKALVAERLEQAERFRRSRVDRLELRSAHLRDDTQRRRFAPGRARAFLRSLAAAARL